MPEIRPLTSADATALAMAQPKIRDARYLKFAVRSQYRQIAAFRGAVKQK